MNNAYLVERCGDVRSIWGPMSLDKARHDAGACYIPMEGMALGGRMTIRRAELQTLVAIGSAWPLDGTAASTI